MFTNSNEAFKFLKATQQEVIDIQVVEITKLADKRTWLNKFTKAYTVGKDGVVTNAGLDSCRCFVALYEGKEAGYIRLGSYTSAFSKHGAEGEIWSICEAYIKPPYRSKGILRKLIKYVVANCNAKVFRIQTYRLTENFSYYFSLGFTYSYQVGDSDMSVVSLGECRHILENYCAARLAEISS